MRIAAVGLLRLCALIVVSFALIGLCRSASVHGQKKPATAAENYKTHCATCHMPDGVHFMPLMGFTDDTWKHGSSVEEIRKVISEGVKGTAMMPFKERLTDEEILELASYVRAFDKKLKPETKKQPAASPKP